MQKKTPLWPLYVADALMFLTVLAVCVPNIRLYEPLGVWQAAILALLVFVAMLLVLAPYVIGSIADVKIAKLNAAKSKIQGEEQVRTIFADLRTLRNSLIEQMENTQNAKNLADSLAQELLTEKMKLKKLEETLGQNSQKLRADSEAIESFKSVLDEFKSELGAAQDDSLLEPRVSELERNSKALSEDFAEIKKQIEKLISEIQSALNIEGCDSDFEETPAEIAEAPQEQPAEDSESSEQAEEFSDDEGEDFIDAEAEVDSDEAREDSQADAELDADDKDVSDEEGEVQTEESIAKHDAENGISDTEVEEPIKRPSSQPNWAGMIDKALLNSQASNTRSVVSKFIEKNKAGEAPETSDASEPSLSEKLGEPDVSESESAEEIEDSKEYKDLEKQQSGKSAQAALFDESEIPESKKAKPAKSGETAIIANAFLGIGNKPFVRGSSAGLNPDKGVAMQMLEIGKWQWICEALPTDPIKITIWLNDEKPSTLGEIVLNPGETLDIDLSF